MFFLCLGPKCFVWGSVMLLVWDFFSNISYILFLHDLGGPDSCPVKDRLESSAVGLGGESGCNVSICW